tara:strand:+ start:620 stop:775 length:156 start_codon:yes stop_codon:yes gene_type:complete
MFKKPSVLIANANGTGLRTLITLSFGLYKERDSFSPNDVFYDSVHIFLIIY